MPSIFDESRPEFIKALHIGEQGSGKTGALAALANAGYRVRILDCEAGTQVLGGLFLPDGTLGSNGKPSPYKFDSHKNLSKLTVTEQLRKVKDRMIPLTANAWDKCLTHLTNWTDGDDKPGNVATWGPRSIFVLDTLSSISRFALNTHLAQNARLAGPIYQADWGVGQSMIDGLLEMLTSDEVKTNVIINCHVTYMGGEFSDPKTQPGLHALPAQGFPKSLGKKLSQDLGGKFNTILEFASTGFGPAAKQKIFTKTRGLIKLKSTAPLKAKAEYPLETGLADYWRDVLGDLA